MKSFCPSYNDCAMFQLTEVLGGCGVTYLQAELMLNFTDYQATKHGGLTSFHQKRSFDRREQIVGRDSGHKRCFEKQARVDFIINHSLALPRTAHHRAWSISQPK